MQCPLCKTEMAIAKNKIVRRKDGTFARKLSMMCRSRTCPNYGEIVTSVYNPVDIVDDDETT